MAVSQFCGINAIIYYSTKIFETAGGSTNAAFTSSVWVGFTSLVFTFVAIAFVKAFYQGWQGTVLYHQIKQARAAHHRADSTFVPDNL
jgi:hypothetical protein